MKKIRIIVLLLCFSFFLHFSAPIVNAYETDINQTGSITVSGNIAAYTYVCTEYYYCVYLDTSTSIGSFAISYSEYPNYVYEYLFTFTSDAADINSDTYWNNLVSDCFTNSSLWKSTYLPPNVSAPENISNNTMSITDDYYTDYFLEWLYNYYGTTSYTGRAIATNYVGSLIFLLHEDFYLAVYDDRGSFTSTQALSAAGFIVSVIGAVVSPTLLSVIGALVSLGGLIPANTTVEVYTLSARQDRYVKRLDSSIWLNSTQGFTTFLGYVNRDSGYYAVDTGSINQTYSHSQNYFEDYSQQFDDAYNYYLILP